MASQPHSGPSHSAIPTDPGLASSPTAASRESATGPVAVRQLHFRDRTLRLEYPSSVPMDGAFGEVFTNQDYPFLSFVGPGPIVDVGANVGFASVWFALLYPQKTIYSFEPGREAYHFLHLNSKTVDNIRPFHCGWYDRDAEVSLFLGSATCHHSMGESSLASSQGETVKVRRASQVLKELKIDHISVLKVDTEGAEIAIFRDLEPMFDRIDSIFFEYHSEADRIELDRLLNGQFMLYSGRVLHAHRGTFGYVSRRLIRERTNLDQFAITRPKI